MNMQALMAQAQRMQKDLLKKKEEISKKEFIGKSELVEVIFNGDKKVKSINITKEHALEVEDIEILEDMLQIAINDAMKQIDKEMNDKMGAAAGSLNGIF